VKFSVLLVLGGFEKNINIAFFHLVPTVSVGIMPRFEALLRESKKQEAGT
jgi:hypothetical protein